MPEISALSRVTNIRVEGTSGTDPGSGSKRLRTIGFEFKPQATIDAYRPMGNKYVAVVTPQKESMQFGVTGRPSYNEIIYPLNSVITAGVITTPAGGTLSRQHKFTPATAAEDAPKTYTIEQGSATRAQKASYGIFTELGAKFNRASAELSGSAMGQLLTDAITLAVGPGSIALQQILSKEIIIYADDTFAGIGTTKLLRVLEFGFNISGRYGPLWTLDSANASFAAHVETEPTVAISMKMAADAVGYGLLTTMRAGTTKYIRLKAIGPIIEGAIPYSFQIDLVGQITAAPDPNDTDGLYTLDWEFTAVDDAVHAPYEITVVNTVTAL